GAALPRGRTARMTDPGTPPPPADDPRPEAPDLPSPSGPPVPQAPAPRPPAPVTDAAGERARAALHALRDEVAKAVVGQEQAVSGLVVALLAGGHVLLEGVPGTAKTLLVRTLAAALDVRT